MGFRSGVTAGEEAPAKFSGCPCGLEGVFFELPLLRVIGRGGGDGAPNAATRPAPPPPLVLALPPLRKRVIRMLLLLTEEALGSSAEASVAEAGAAGLTGAETRTGGGPIGPHPRR